MEDQVATAGEKLNMPPQHIAQPALDAVAFVRLAQHLAGGEPYARTERPAASCGARNQLIEAEWRLRLAAA